MKKKTRVAVLRGGPSSEYEVSLKTGAAVLSNLPEHYEGVDVFIDKKGVWHIKGVIVEPINITKKADVVFNAMHGEYGEDGKVQRLLEHIGIPFTGSGSLASALGMNKALTKRVLKDHSIKTPHHRVLTKKEFTPDLYLELHRTFPQPSVIKPASGGSSVGTSIARTADEIALALERAFAHDNKVLIEEYIKGKEGTCGVLEDFRGKEIYHLLPIEIVPNGQKFFDYESKYSDTNGASEICPGNFTKDESEQMQIIAEKVHRAIDARHYSRTDFIVHPKRGIYTLEINTLPGLTPASLLPKAIKAIGSSYGELLDHLIQLALKGKK